MIFVVGPPRSGTSITTRVLQAHLGEFPFEVNRHAEPERLVRISHDLLERNGMSFEDRLYPEGAVVDPQFVRELSEFCQEFRDAPCVVKEPIFTAFYAQAPFFRRGAVVSVNRPTLDRARSFMSRKKMPGDLALKASEFWDVQMRTLGLERPHVEFDDDRDSFSLQVRRACRRLGIEFDEAHVEAHWIQSDLTQKA